MEKYTLNFEATGCPNTCMHCYCSDLKRQPELIPPSDIMVTARAFRGAMSSDVGVLLLQEQTMYPDFITLTKQLRSEGFMRKTNDGLLVTNGFGLARDVDLLQETSKLFGGIKMTLFGLEDEHDRFVSRKGHFNEILKVTQHAKTLGLNVIWQLMVSSRNPRQMGDLQALATQFGVSHSFVTAGYHYSGQLLTNASAIPHQGTLDQVTASVYEVAEGSLFTEADFYKGIAETSDEGIEKVGLTNLYVDSSFDVYPLSAIRKPYKLGNLRNGLKELVDALKTTIVFPYGSERERIAPLNH